MSDNFFYEEQRFTQRWIKITLGVLWVGLTAAAIIAMATKKIGPIPALLSIAPISALILFFSSLKLQVRIDTDAINYRFLPIQWKYRTIKREDIEKMDVITYDPVEDYGGWGIRLSHKGKAYTAKGDQGLSIQLVNGKNLLLGTSKPEELQRWIVHHFVPKTDTPR
jgi:hypothetical protein